MSTATQDAAIAEAPGVDDAPVLKRRGMPHDAEIDMTPMIDCVFLLNIFFILTFNADPARLTNLPVSVTGTPLDPRNAVVVTITEGADRAPVVYLGQGQQGAPLPADEESQREIILQELQAGAAQGKTIFAIMAEKGVREGDVRRVAGLVNEVEGMTLAFPVQEIQE